MRKHDAPHRADRKAGKRLISMGDRFPVGPIDQDAPNRTGVFEQMNMHKDELMHSICEHLAVFHLG